MSSFCFNVGTGINICSQYLVLHSFFFCITDSTRRKETLWKQRCTAIEGMVNQYQATYTVQPLPKNDHYLQASVFYQREKLALEGVADGKLCGCLWYRPMFCQRRSTLFNRSYSLVFNTNIFKLFAVGDLSPQHFVRSRGWSYVRLAMDGLRSTVFDGTSPTHCIASGNVWLDHACSDQSGCLSHQTVLTLHARKTESGSNPVFDWTRFYSRDQVCLRLSESKFKVQKCTA